MATWQKIAEMTLDHVAKNGRIGHEHWAKKGGNDAWPRGKIWQKWRTTTMAEMIHDHEAKMGEMKHDQMEKIAEVTHYHEAKMAEMTQDH